MIQLETQTKLYILGAVVALTQLPRTLPYIKAGLSWLHTKHVSFNYSTIFNSNTLVLAAVAFMLFMPNTPSVTPTPEPVVPVVQKDKLDESTEVYRSLLYDVWTEFAAKRSTFKTDEEALKWINQRLVATYTAAYKPVTDLASDAARSGGDPQKFAEAIKNRSL